MNRLQLTFASLKHRNFRLWFVGQIVSLFGTWMQMTAQGFLIYELTGSSAFLGYVGFANGLPSWMFMLLGGVVADRIPRRTLMVITQSAMLALAFILAGLTFAGLIQPWQILFLTFLLGVANAFDAPARLALVKELVDREDMTNAIALNATMFNTAAIVGPALAGVVYAAVGPAWCFSLNGFSFLAVIVALLMMKIPPGVVQQVRASTRIALVEGFTYLRRNRLILSLIAIVGSVALFGMSFVTLMPAWAVEVLGGDVKTNGLMQAARGLGALLGSLAIAGLGRFHYRGKLLTAGTFAMPLILLIFSFLTWTPASLLALVGIGITSITIMNLANSSVQTSVDDNLRGRIMSIYSLVFFGFFPIGAMLFGQIAEYTSEQTAVRFGAIMLGLAATLLFLLAPRIRKME